MCFACSCKAARSRLALGVLVAQPGAMDVLEDKMALFMHRVWMRLARRAVRDAIAQVLGVRKARRSLESISAELADVIADRMAPYKDALRGVIKNVTSTAYSFGKKVGLNFGAELHTIPSIRDLADVDTRAIDYLYTNDMFWIGQHWNRDVRQRIVGAVMRSTLLTNVADRYSAAAELQAEFLGQFDKSSAYWETVSAAVVQRSRNFGLLSGMDEAGVLYVRIANPAPVSAICKRLVGTQYPISVMIDQRDAMMEAASPDDVKQLQPWVDEKAIADLKPNSPNFAAELAKRGIAMPPYHGRCKSTIVAD